MTPDEVAFLNDIARQICHFIFRRMYARQNTMYIVIPRLIRTDRQEGTNFKFTPEIKSDFGDNSIALVMPHLSLKYPHDDKMYTHEITYYNLTLLSSYEMASSMVKYHFYLYNRMNAIFFLCIHLHLCFLCLTYPSVYTIYTRYICLHLLM